MEKCIKEMYKILKTEILEIRRRNALWKQSVPYFVSWQNQKVTYEKYVWEKWKIHKTEWTEIRGWEDIFARVTSHLSRAGAAHSEQDVRQVSQSVVVQCLSYHRHGHQHHIKHADSYKNKYWALNMMLFLFFARKTSSKMKNCFSGYFYLPMSSSSMCLQLGPDLALDNVALVTLDVS